MVSAPRCRPGARGLLALLMLLPLPGARGLCGTLPRLRRAIPRDTSRTEGFPINAEVTYKCVDGCVKIPGKSDTVVCLSNSEWSSIGEFCDHDCGAPPRLKSAALSKEDERKNYHPSRSTVRYVCRPGYERTELTPVITCLENLTWSESPEFCRGKSCGAPKGPEHGRAVDVTNVLYGAKVNIICDDGFRLRGRTFIQCLWKGDQVEWSPLPTCQGLCGTLPRRRRSIPRDTNHTEGFPINAEMTNIAEVCDHDCGAPPRLKSAALSKEDERKSYHPRGSTVRYVCRPGYERTELTPVITCLENLTWSESPEFCRGKSCGAPKGPEHGRAVDVTNVLYGAKVNIICDDGFRLRGRTFIQCLWKGDQVEWSPLPTCQAITCSPPPNIANGTHNGSNMEIFHYNSLVTYKCDPNFSLIGEASIHCTTKDNINGVWNGSAPECKVIIITQDKPTTVPPEGAEGAGLCGTLPRLRRAIPRDTNHTEGFPINAEVTYKCVDGCVKIPGKSDTVVCLSNSEWSSIGEFCDHDCGAPPRLKSAALSKEDERKNYHPRGSTVRYVCHPGYERTELTPVITCLENLTWSESPEFCRGPRIDKHGMGIGIGIGIGTGIIAFSICAGIVVAYILGQKKKRSYGVNLDSRKHHITTEHDFQMSETKSNLILKV
ncbi:complement receptor type 1-like isoform X6 [Eretmochelys imbricata]